jgi:hypothetical protein
MRAPEYHWIVGDVETAPRADSDSFIGDVEPHKGYKDADLIAEDLAKKKAAKRAQCGLDWNTNRIVSICYQTNAMPSPCVLLCKNEDEEREAVREFWAARYLPHVAKLHRTFVGFRNGEFDAPVLVQRSRLLGLGEPDIRIGRYDNDDIRDLYRMLTFDGIHHTKVMSETLESFCRLFGIDVPDDIHGSQIAQLVAEGRWDDVASHNFACVGRTRQLAERLAAIYVPSAEPMEVS